MIRKKRGLKTDLRKSLRASLRERQQKMGHVPEAEPLDPEVEAEALAAIEEAFLEEWRAEKAALQAEREQYEQWCEDNGLWSEWDRELEEQSRGVITEWMAAKRRRRYQEEKDQEYLNQGWAEIDGERRYMNEPDFWEWYSKSQEEGG